MSSDNCESEGSPFMCSICREQENSADKLISPCKCSGTLKYVHFECIALWITTNSTNKCLICHSLYTDIDIQQKRRSFCEYLQEFSIFIVFPIILLTIVFYFSLISYIQSVIAYSYGHNFSSNLTFYSSIVFLMFGFASTLVSFEVMSDDFNYWREVKIRYEVIPPKHKNLNKKS